MPRKGSAASTAESPTIDAIERPHEAHPVAARVIRPAPKVT